MIKNVLGLCSEGVIVDQLTNNVSIFNIIEEINATEFPFIFHKFTAMNTFHREPKDPVKNRGYYKIFLNKIELAKQDFELDFKDSLKARYILTLEGVPITEPGDLMVECHFANQKMSEYKIKIAKVSQLPGPPREVVGFKR